MNPYTQPGEKKIGAKRPKIQHLAEDPTNRRTPSERQAEKSGVFAERRAIKKSARRHLQKQLLADLSESE